MAITAALLGAGGRGFYSYAPYADLHPEKLTFVAVAEPKKHLLKAFAQQYDVPKEGQFGSWKDLLALPPVADCIMICTQDDMHYEPCMKVIAQGYKYILIEKPISPSQNECEEIARFAREKGATVMVCHSLRYTPFYRQIKKIIDNGTIGDVIHIDQTESVGFFHHAHSFVRGDWNVKEESAPMILAKCCHDLDILLYLTGKTAKTISSFGDLIHFKSENAPKGAPKHCVSGCPAQADCPFYAPRIYMSIAPYFKELACEKEGFTDLHIALKKGRYGRCVYKCGANVVDHQVVNIRFGDETTAALTMIAYTAHTKRDTRVFGTRGEIVGCMEDNKITVHEFVTGKVTEYHIETNSSMHAGADEIMMGEFVQVVSGQIPCPSEIDHSIQSHAMAHAAEKSRLELSTVTL